MSMRKLSNPPNPWSSTEIEYIGEPPTVPLTVYEEEATSILSENKSPDIGFRYSVNPYRGCYHACAYCYARVTHQYLDFGAGSDFDRKIVVKVNAADRLREAFERRSWSGEIVVLSGVTDCYQPLEASYGITRAVLEVCHEYRNPVGIVTKSGLIRRDIDLLTKLARDARLSVYLSIPFADPETGRAVEPTAPAPAARFAALRALADVGIEVGVAVAPIIPGLNDQQIVEVLERAAEAGATRAFRILLHLSREVRDVFEERIQETLPLRYQRIMASLVDSRDGRTNTPEFGRRWTGQGARWEATDQLFRVTCRRLGLNESREEDAHRNAMVESTFRRPGEMEQRELF